MRHQKKNQLLVQYLTNPGNNAASKSEKCMQSIDNQIKTTQYPTVLKGEERLRVSLHSYNLLEEIEVLLATIKDFQNNFGVRI